MSDRDNSTLGSPFEADTPQPQRLSDTKDIGHPKNCCCGWCGYDTRSESQKLAAERMLALFDHIAALERELAKANLKLDGQHRMFTGLLGMSPMDSHVRNVRAEAAEADAQTLRQEHEVDRLKAALKVAQATERAEIAEAALKEERERGRAELAAAKFAPMGDNHHNAAKCPYCQPQLAKTQERER